MEAACLVSASARLAGKVRIVVNEISKSTNAFLAVPIMEITISRLARAFAIATGQDMIALKLFAA